MPKYANLSGRSGVTDYEIAPDHKSIAVTFKGGKTYTYDTEDNGDYMISKMAGFGDHGEFLNRMINRDKPSFSIGDRVGKGAPDGGGNDTLREEDEKAMSAIHAKYVFGKDKKSMTEQLSSALTEKEKQAKYRQERMGSLPKYRR